MPKQHRVYLFFLQARRWRVHESRAQSGASSAQQHEASGVNTISSVLAELIPTLALALAWVCIYPLVWAGQQARYCYMCCLHNLPSYKSELSAAATKHQLEKAELQKRLQELAMQHDTAAKQLAAKDSELAALQASDRAAQSEVDTVQRQLDALAAAYSDVQHQLDSSAYQFERMQKRLDAKDAEIAAVRACQQSALKKQEQQHQEALHAYKEAAEALVSQAQHQSNAAADAAHCSQQKVLRNLQRERNQLTAAVRELEQEKAALLSEGLSHLQQLKVLQDAVLGWQQAFTTLQHDAQSQLYRAEQDAQSQLDRAEQETRDKEISCIMLHDALQDLQEAQVAVKEAEDAKGRMLDELHPVHYAEVKIHFWPAP